MTRQEQDNALKVLKNYDLNFCKINGMLFSAEEIANAFDLAIKALEQTRWIPVKWHEITEEEREREGYPAEWGVYLDNPMPGDNEEILITVKNRRGRVWVEKDTNYIDDDGNYLDSGYDWVEDIVAWMPLLEPYKAESEDKE